MEKRVFDRVGEAMYHKKLENGLNVFVFPKPDFQKGYAFFAANYGGMDMRFYLDGEQHDTHYDPVGKYRGVDLDAGIGFSVFKKVYFGFGYNAILGKKITPFFTNLNISIGVVI